MIKNYAMPKDSVVVPKYEKGEVIIEMSNRDGKIRHCSDSYYGEYDCAFCDARNWGEESIISIEDKCYRCGAIVISVSCLTLIVGVKNAETNCNLLNS